MTFRTNKYGRRYPITPKKGGISIDAFNDSLRQDEARKKIVLQKAPNQESFLQRLKPNKVEVTLDPKNAYIPSAKATWNLKPEGEQKA